MAKEAPGNGQRSNRKQTNDQLLNSPRGNWKQPRKQLKTAQGPTGKDRRINWKQPKKQLETASSRRQPFFLLIAKVWIITDSVRGTHVSLKNNHLTMDVAEAITMN